MELQIICIVFWWCWFSWSQQWRRGAATGIPKQRKKEMVTMVLHPEGGGGGANQGRWMWL
jgi:hypothetical protein